MEQRENGGDNREGSCSPERVRSYVEVTAGLATGTQERIWALNKQVQRTGREMKLEVGINYRAVYGPAAPLGSIHCHPLLRGQAPYAR